MIRDLVPPYDLIERKMAEKAYLAIDMGASSGRLMIGRFDGQRLRLEEVHRFENGPVDLAGRLYWDLPGLWSSVRQGLSAAAAEGGGPIVSVGVDTWGVDFALLGRNDELLGNPYHYRDSRTNGMVERAFSIVPREEIFRHTGLQFMQINTLYQLLAMKLGKSPLLDVAETILLMPDLMHWLLTGVKCNEMTEASTSQFYNPVKVRLGYGTAWKSSACRRIFSARSCRRARRSGRSAAALRPKPVCGPRSCCPAPTIRPAP